jgi:hypothetical protein
VNGSVELDRGRLPVLTEVVALPADAPPATGLASTAQEVGEAVRDRAPALGPWAPSPAEAEAVDTDAIVQRVLAALQPRLDAWFEARVRDALAPALERLADGAAAEARGALGASLRALVVDAVEQTLAEQHPRRGVP